jgi:DNA-binding winged helix-turn-helix (wHTH) protein/tetratricopeptide (TPR) repeat protein
MNSQNIQVLRVGDWRVDPALDEISKEGTSVKLEPRAMRLLVCLAERAGQVVSVEQLLDEVWKDVVVTPNSVYHAVATLRRVLSDNTKEPTYITDVLRRGYRLVAPVQWVDAAPQELGLPAGLQGRAEPRIAAKPWLRSRVLWSVPILLVALVTLAFFVTLRPHKPMLVVLPFENLSVRGSKERIRVTAQLISSGDQTHIWAQSFDRDASDVLRLQSEVARAIAEKIQLTLPPKTAARLNRSPSLNPQAHEAFLEGLDAENQRTKQTFERAIAAFSRAIVLDPQYALAYAELARTYSLATVFGLGTPTEMMINARNAATTALQIDASVAAAHTTLGFIHAHLEFDWPAAEKEFRRGIELNSSDANAHLFFSNSLLSPLGRHDDAIAEMKIAIRLDPLSAPVDSFLGRTYLWARRYNDALTHLQQSVQHFPHFVLNHVGLAHLYPYIEKFDEAIAEEREVWLSSGLDASESANRADAMHLALASKGPHGYWEKVLEFSQSGVSTPEAYSSSYGVALLYTRLGENDRAIESLELALSQRQLAMAEIGIEPAFDPLRSDPRFVNLLRRVGIRIR